MYISVSCCKVFVWVHEIIYLLVIFLKAIRLFSSDSLLVPVKQSSIKGLGYRCYDRKAVQKEQEGKERENGGGRGMWLYFSGSIYQGFMFLYTHVATGKRNKYFSRGD